jgi:hypothetical protein
MPLIEVNHLTKEYQLGHITSLKENILNTFMRLGRKPLQQRDNFIALDDVDLKRFPRMNIPKLRRIFVHFQGVKRCNIASYLSLFTMQKMDKKTSKLGIFFAGNRLIINEGEVIGINGHNQMCLAAPPFIHSVAKRWTKSQPTGLRINIGADL